MGFNPTTGILTAPFHKLNAESPLADLQLALGRTGGGSHLQLCRDVDANNNPVGAINKWAKYKPSNHPKLVGPLTGDERRVGANDGTYYGLEINVIVPDSQGSILAIHNSTFNYTGRPTSVNGAPCRVSDFVDALTNSQRGYAKYAEPTPGLALSSATAYIDLTQSLNLSGGYYPDNQVGVNLSAIVFGTDTPSEAQLGITYPCILVDKYVTALSDGIPLMQNGTAHMQWYVDFSKTVYNGSGAPFGSGETLQATVFLAQFGNNTSDQNTLSVLRDHWIDMEEPAIWFSHQIVPIPVTGQADSDCGFTIVTDTYTTPTILVDPDGVEWYNTDNLACKYSVTNTGYEGCTITVTISHDRLIANPVSKTFLADSAVQNRRVIFYPTDFAVSAFPSGNYTIEVEIIQQSGRRSTQTYTLTK